jgi:hypothetical protein
VEAEIALDAAVIATLGMARLLGGAAGVAGTAANLLADIAQRRADLRTEAIRAAEHEEQIVHGVLARNATIGALRDSAARHGLRAVALPEPLDLGGRDPAELSAWCDRVDTELADAERTLSEAIANNAIARISPAADASLQEAATAAGPAAGSARREPGGEARPTARATLIRVMARLLPDTSDEDQAWVATAAERIGAEPNDTETHLAELRLRVQTANRRTRDHRDERSLADRLARELTALPAAERVRSDLAAVAAGTRALDSALRTEAMRLGDEARERDQRRYVASAISAAFADLGYEVSEGFETLTAADGEAVLTRGDWPQHAVKVRVDGHNVRAAMVRTTTADSLDQRRVDREREEQWCASFEEARARLAASGINANVRWRVEPGVQQLPVATVRRPAGRTTPAERRRHLDR